MPRGRTTGRGRRSPPVVGIPKLPGGKPEVSGKTSKPSVPNIEGMQVGGYTLSTKPPYVTKTAAPPAPTRGTRKPRTNTGGEKRPFAGGPSLAPPPEAPQRRQPNVTGGYRGYIPPSKRPPQTKYKRRSQK